MADRALNGISLCTGGGGLELGVELCVRRARPVCYVEREAFAIARLGEAFDAGCMAPAPVYSDARTFDGRPWRGVVDFVAAGIPCQPWSAAGQRRGAADARDLRDDFLRIVGECGPSWVFGEQVAAFLGTGYAHVRTGLEAMGYWVAEGIYRAAEVGAPHLRARLFFLAHADCAGVRDTESIERTGGLSPLAVHDGSPEPLANAGYGHRTRPETGIATEHWNGLRPSQQRQEGAASALDSSEDVADAPRCGRARISGAREERTAECGWWDAEPDVGRVADGVADRVDRLRMLGNGVVPLQAAHAYTALGARHFGACWAALTL